MAHRNRWFTVLKKWWIFPLRSVNVITRWYFHLRHLTTDPRVKVPKRWDDLPTCLGGAWKATPWTSPCSPEKLPVLLKKFQSPLGGFNPFLLVESPWLYPFWTLSDFGCWKKTIFCRLNPKTIGWIICFYGGLLTGLASHETELGKPTPQTPAQSAKSGELTIK